MMIKIILTLLIKLIAIVVIDSKFHDYERIYNGTEAKTGQFPFISLILGKDDKMSFTCTGSIINKDMVMTTARCFQYVPANKVIAAAGAVELTDYTSRRFSDNQEWTVDLRDIGKIQERRGSLYHLHPKYETNKSYDIGLIKLSAPFTLNADVGVISLAKDPLKPGATCLKLGYGKRGDGEPGRKLMYATTTSIKQKSECGSNFQREGHYYCAINEVNTLCMGDSGGPLVCNRILYGINDFIVGIHNESSYCGAKVLEWFIDLPSYENEKAFVSTYVSLTSDPSGGIDTGTGTGVSSSPRLFVTNALTIFISLLIMKCL